MELSNLYYFKTVAELENITRAAEKHFVSQPALSKSIAKMEKSLGVNLFERRKGRLCLTDYGRVYYSYVSKAIDLLEQGDAMIQEMKTASNDKVSVASSAGELLQAVLVSFVKQHGAGIEVAQHVFQPEYLTQKLLDGEVDFVITPVTIEESEVEQIKLTEEEVFLVVNPKHRLAGEKYAALLDVAGDPFLVNDTYFDRKITSRFCELAGFKPNIVLCSNETELINQALNDNLGVSLIPGFKVAQMDSSLAVPLRVTDVQMVRLISIAKRRDTIFTENAKTLYDFTSRYFRQLGKQMQDHYSEIFPRDTFEHRINLGIHNLKAH